MKADEKLFGIPAGTYTNFDLIYGYAKINSAGNAASILTGLFVQRTVTKVTISNITGVTAKYADGTTIGTAITSATGSVDKYKRLSVSVVFNPSSLQSHRLGYIGIVCTMVAQ